MSFEVSLEEAMDRAAELSVSTEPLSYDERCVLLLRAEVRQLSEKTRNIYDELCRNFSVYNLVLKKLARVEALLTMDGHLDREDIRAALKGEP